jgi:hypothetical protein
MKRQRLQGRTWILRYLRFLLRSTGSSCYFEHRIITIDQGATKVDISAGPSSFSRRLLPLMSPLCIACPELQDVNSEDFAQRIILYCTAQLQECCLDYSTMFRSIVLASAASNCLS